MGDDSLTQVRDRFVAVNGDHPMTPEDDAYVRKHFVPAAPGAIDLMLEGRLPLPSYVLSDGTPMVPATHGTLAEVAGGLDRLHDWFVAFWDDRATGEEEWAAYLSGQYVCLREVTPARIIAKTERIADATRAEGCCAATRTTRSAAACSARRSMASSRWPGSTSCCCP
ncbi:DUF6058 family natural product biosynthesis protein [Nocardioides KLBMP 9356]|uniref:DUF6058 family natural product biosynthesis protein n=1 Tax=Nocardioides potassii TaxID=2911371 RepID=A0ABS9HCW3_9ACTN|nr:DUF6058 family natural product biosynthesis protein [Nocardioides potassii]MCF6378339.1 DUF6058 family natural product biosynthesis protein [Nocardioides potassii]